MAHLDDLAHEGQVLLPLLDGGQEGAHIAAARHTLQVHGVVIQAL